jgi:hypothetical protein
MRTRAKEIHIAVKPSILHILFLSEGFQSNPTDKDAFYNQCDLLKDSLLNIKPYCVHRSQISIWAFFEPSKASGIISAEPDTAFKFFIKNGEVTTKHPGKIIDVIKKLDVFPYAREAILPERGEEIWLSDLKHLNSVVCIILNNPCRELAQCKLKYDDYDFPLEYPSVASLDKLKNHPELNLLLPYIVITRYPWIEQPGLDMVQTTFPEWNKRIFAAEVLVHELGHFFGLFDEYEKDGVRYEAYSESEPEPGYPNLTALQTLKKPDGTIDTGKIKWGKHIEQSRKQNICLVEHPKVAEPGGDWKAIDDLSVSETIFLKHRYDDNPKETEKNWLRYIYETGDNFLDLKCLLDLKRVNLIEGGRYYRRNIFRPSVECMMRFSGRNNEKNKYRLVVDYCKVCEKHIEEQLTGISNFILGEIRIKSGNYPKGKKLESKLADAFVRVINQPEDTFSQADPRLYCVAATLRRYEAFFKHRLEWENFYKPFRLGDDPKWGGETVSMPGLNANPKKQYNSLVYLWISNLKQQKARNYIHKYAAYAAMGAPGALAASRFGFITNRYIPDKEKIENEETHEEETITFRRLKGLTEADLDNLMPGSLLQIWPNEEVYCWCILYVQQNIVDAHKCVAKAKAAVPSSFPYRFYVEDDSPHIPGHSLIYMGKRNERYHVADQYGKDKDLKVNWYSFKFWIAAQWYEVENIKKFEFNVG